MGPKKPKMPALSRPRRTSVASLSGSPSRGAAPPVRALRVTRHAGTLCNRPRCPDGPWPVLLPAVGSPRHGRTERIAMACAPTCSRRRLLPWFLSLSLHEQLYANQLAAWRGSLEAGVASQLGFVLAIEVVSYH